MDARDLARYDARRRRAAAEERYPKCPCGNTSGRGKALCGRCQEVQDRRAAQAEQEQAEEEAFNQLAALAWWSENDYLSREELERRLSSILTVVRERLAARRRG